MEGKGKGVWGEQERADFGRQRETEKELEKEMRGDNAAASSLEERWIGREAQVRSQRKIADSVDGGGSMWGLSL